ncbi:MAG TPA: hypothetical protein VF721_09360 [Pyrinomonadaceae bacterium]|jgi:hypothetical protein
MNKVSGFFDASGKQETLDDKVLVVAASLATPFYWQEFSKEWIEYLIDKEYPIKKGKTKPTFHTVDFHYGNYPLRKDFGWDEDRKKDLYDGLIRLIKRRTEYSVATAVDLEDYRRFVSEYPASVHMWTNAGMFASAMCLFKCREWAEARKYDETISYIYDRNDTFAADLRDEYNYLCDNPEAAKWWYFKAGGLTDGNKEIHIPIQSVDLVAWEVARNYKEAQKASPDGDFKTRHELIELSHVNAEYKLYGYEDFVIFWHDHVEDGVLKVKEDLLKRGVIKTDAEFDEEHEKYARKLLNLTTDEIEKLKDDE